MATIRKTALISRPPDEVWKIVDDASAIAQWFPLIEKSRVEGSRRLLILKGGATVVEEIIARDSSLRRFQYRIIGGDIPVVDHLATIDVIEIGSRSLVVYGTDVTPDSLVELIDPAVAEAVDGLREKLTQ